MKFLVSGASGMIGTEIVSRLTASGGEVIRLTRAASSPDGARIHWNPEADEAPELPEIEFDTVIHLAGENIASGRWNEERKARIRESRVNGARLLSFALARLKHPARVLVGASAVGYYGDRGDEILDEESSAGRGFLASVCRELEDEIALAGERGTRTVRLRFGVVLSERAGALRAMLRPFRAGLGGALGSGRQYMSWITLEDAARAIEHCVRTEPLRGPVIGASPQPATNREFVRSLGRVLGRPAALRVPAFALRLALGEMAGELLLGSQRAHPARLLSTGFLFLNPDLEGALRSLLGPTA
ncbi:MAG: TIGR01777 family oxidoreductase [Terriglobia bacterium]